MSTSIFQCGEWTGFYTYQGRTSRHRMNLVLEFKDGRITGEGRDDIGEFFITGRYDPGSGECSWHKGYIGQHTVYYEGCGDGKSIRGTWSIDWSGGFHIWPVGEGEERTEAEIQEEPIVTMSVQSGAV